MGREACKLDIHRSIDKGEAMMAISSKAKGEQRKDDLFDKSLKRAGSRSHARGVDGLTCSEAQVDAILSEGEST
jgi:hypothetical protein